MSVAALPKTALAAVLTEYNEPLGVEELPIVAPEPGALLVKVSAATVCGSDVHIWEGQLEGVLEVRRPIVLGHEIVGEVAAIGAGAELDSIGREIRIGDRVVWEHEACGHCPTCTIEREPGLCPNRRIGQLQPCHQPPYFTGGFAQYSYVWPKSGRLIVPGEVRTPWASAASCALRTVVNAFDRLGSIDFLDTVLIQGAGPLGLFATAVARTLGAGRVVVVGAPADRLQIARAWGADETLDIADHRDGADRIAAVRELTGDGAQVGLELSGAHGAFAEGLQMISRGGRYMVVGTIGGNPQAVPAHLITTRQIRVSGTMGAAIGSYHKALEFMRRTRHEFDFDLMLGRTYGLDEVTMALEQNRSQAEIKPIIDPTQLAS
jgi:L-iditol 2-dehydrogenase